MSMINNTQLINFEQSIPVDDIQSKWDFVKLHKALFYTIYNDKKNKNYRRFIQHLKRNGLVLGEGNYRAELMTIEKMFNDRYNLLRKMKIKINSLQFIKNGKYINAVKKLEKWKAKLSNSKYVKEMELLKTQLINSDLLNESQKNQLNKYNNFLQLIQKYEQTVIGGSLKVIKTNQKEEEEKYDFLEKIEILNREYAKNGNIDAQLENIKYQLKQKQKEQTKEKEDESKIYLKSQMIRHLKIFFEINNIEAHSLLEDFTFNKVIKINSAEVARKLQKINKELKSYEPIVEYLTHLQIEKTFLCPHCTFDTNMAMNVAFHIQKVHPKESYITPLLVIKPYRNENVYDGKKKKDNENLFHHMKNKNKIIRDNTGMILLPENVRKNMNKNSVHIDAVKEKLIQSEKFQMEFYRKNAKKSVKRRVKQFQKLVIKDQGETFEESIKAKNARIMQYLTSDEVSYVDKIIKEGKKISNSSLAYRWVDSMIVNYLIQKIIKISKIDTIKVTVNKQYHFTYLTIEQMPKQVRDVVVNGNVLIENGILKDQKKFMEITRKNLINVIKTEIIKEKLINFARPFTKLIIKRDTMFNQTESMLKNSLPEFFEKILFGTRTDIDDIFDDIIDSLNGMNSENINERIQKELTSKINRLGGEEEVDVDKIREKIEEGYKIDELVIGQLLNEYDNESKKKASVKSLNDILYYMLLSYLKSDNNVVENIYSLIQREDKENELDNNFGNKHQVWEWINEELFHNKEDFKNNKENFKNITLDKVLNKIFDDESNDFKMIRQLIYEKVNDNYNMFDQMSFANYKPKRKRSEVNKIKTINELVLRNDIKDFIINCSYRKILPKMEKQRVMALLLFIKMNRTLEITKTKKSGNAEVVNKFLNVMNIYVKKEKSLIIKSKPTEIHMPVLQQQADEDEMKDELLNDFMGLDEDAMNMRALHDEEMGRGISMRDNEPNDIESQNYSVIDDFINEDDNEENYNDNFAEDLDEEFQMNEIAREVQEEKQEENEEEEDDFFDDEDLFGSD